MVTVSDWFLFGVFALVALWLIVRTFHIGTIRTRLLVSFVALALLPLILFAAAGVVMTYQSAKQNTITDLESVAAFKEAEVSALIQNLEVDLGIGAGGESAGEQLRILLKEASATLRWRAYQGLQDEFQMLIEGGQRSDELFVMDAQGRVVLSTDVVREDEVYDHERFFQEGMMGRSYVRPPSHSDLLGWMPIIVAWPVPDQEGEVLGVIARRVDQETLIQVMAQQLGLGQAGETYLVDANHALMTPLRSGEKDIYVHSEGIDAALGDAHLSGSGMYRNAQGNPVIGVYRWLPELQVALLVEQGQSEAFSGLYAMLSASVVLTIISGLLALVAALLIARGIANPLASLAEVATQIAAGDPELVARVEREDEIGALARAFNSMTAQLRGLIGSLEERVAERTRALAYRSIQLETAAQVSEVASSILNPRELEQQAVELIYERFAYYYVGLFLVDQSGELTDEPNRWAVLRAGTGEAGRAMLEAGHKLEVGGESMIGRCVAEGQARILLDVGEEAVRFNNPLLPETHSEMALPLIARGRVIGALSVQSEREAAFSDEDISILRTMATQIANAVANAHLFEQTQAALEEANIFRQFVETSGQGVGMANLQGNIIYLNPTFCRLLGETSSKDVIGKPLDGYYPTELRRRLQDEVLPTVLQKGQWVGELALLSSEGKITPTIENFFAIRDENARPRYLANVMTDITERKLMEFEQERRGVQLQTVVEVSRVASSILDTDQLLAMSVNLIRDRFGFYYVGLFLMDDAGEYALLQAGTGEAGRAMLEDGYKLAVGGGTMIGWCVRNKQARIALDIGEEAVRFANPLLPDTRSEMALPLISRGQVIGAMTLQSAEEAAFSKADIFALQSMADQLAVALEQARLYEDAERRAGAMEALYETSLQMTTAREMNQVLQSVVQQAVTLLGAGDGGMYLYDQDADELEWVVGYGPAAEKVGTRLKRGEGLSGKAMEERHPLVIDDYATWDERSSKFEDQPFTSVVAVPLLWQDELVGVLNVASRETFSEDDVRLLALLAQQAAATIANARLLQETQASLQEITRLHQRYLQERWEEFLAEEEARQQAGYLFDQRKVQPAGDLWRPEIEMAVARGRTLALTAEDAEWYDGDGGAKAALVVPLQLRDQIIGALDFFETDRDRQWSAEDVALVEAVADQVALAVENARAYEELQRTARELRELDKLKSQFLANMSHELRTPLNSIIGFSRVMLKGIDGPLTELQETDLTSIYNNGQHLLGLINDILDYSRIEAGKMELVFEPVDLRPIIEGVMSTAIGLVKDRPVKLVKEIADNLPTIRADSTRIRQVVLNLVSNAAKFTEEGSITIRAWIDGPQVAISVADTGVGIPEESLEKVFQEFEQVDGSATRRVGGTGLGLPISRHFVEMHGGRIWVESKEGVGSTFIFTVPIHGPGYVQDPELAALEIDPDRRLLVAVEDSDEMVGFYQHYLEKHGYQVVQLSDGSRASLWVRELSPFAVLLDVLLQETDGWEVLEELKMSRETAHVPVIVCSIVNEEARGLSLGAAAYLTKPVLEDDLLQALALAKELQSS